MRMQKRQFKVEVHAPATRVYNNMLGLDRKETFEDWTSEFNPTSTYEGTWDKGAKMYFKGTDENGTEGGMVSEIAEHIPNQFVSIRHYGILKGTEEVTSGEEVEKWANGFENYTFEEQNGITHVTVDLDVAEGFADYFDATYPKALQKLKDSCE